MKMPIAHRVLATEFADPLGSAIKAQVVIDSIRSAIQFNVQVASELYWQGKQNDYSLESDFAGTLKLPYPSVWMEWNIPRDIVIEGRRGESPHGNSYGCLLSDCANLPGGSQAAGIQALLLIADPNPVQPVRIVPVMSQFQVDQEGNYVKDSIVATYDKMYAQDQAEAKQVVGFVQAHLNVAYIALNLINCKNVTTRKAGDIGLGRSGAAKRRGDPRIEYHTIVLPGMKYETDRQRRHRKPTQDLMAVHRVRGHFKTFTADAPLLGQHVGTYWWGWQVRGSTKNGMVVTDYDVRSAHDTPQTQF